MCIDSEIGGGRDCAADGGGGGYGRRRQMRARALALAALEVTIRSGNRALVRHQLVGVHAQAHRAAGITPFGTKVLEHLIEAFLLRLQTHTGEAGTTSTR